MKFKKRKPWISPQLYDKIIKLCLSPSLEDFEIGRSLLDKYQIKPSRLLWNGNLEYRFKMSPKGLVRWKRYDIRK